MTLMIAYIGFGEAAAAFSGGIPARGYDCKTDDPATRAAKLADFAGAGVISCNDAAGAIDGAGAILSLVTADQALAAAATGARAIGKGALWFDMNSVAPATKVAAAAVIEARGGRYVDVALMSPALPLRRAAPLLVAGPHADAAAATLADAGFTAVEVITGPVGSAAAVKMIRSVMVKGLEALTAECFIAAEMAGVSDRVAAALAGSLAETDWLARADYALDRMMVHGVRRAAEMAEVVRTLDRLGTGSTMSRATAALQQRIGALGLGTVPGLRAKLAAIAAPRAAA